MLVNIVGDLGHGKTLLATIFAIHEKRPVYANYTIHSENAHELKPEMLSAINHPCLVVLDESYSWLESRGSGSNPINKYMSYILYQSRKTGKDIILTEQDIDTIEKRYRRMVHYEIWCYKQERGFLYEIHKNSMLNKKPKTVFLRNEIAEKYYDCYNTYEKVDPIDDSLLLKIGADPTQISQRIDEFADELLNKAKDRNKITKGVVQDYCLDTGLPKDYVDMIYNRIKRRNVMG